MQVVPKKKSFLSNFIVNDWNTIKSSVFSNVVVPGVKTFIANVIYGITNATLFKGGVMGSGNYWNYYNQQSKTANLGWTPIPNASWNSLKPQNPITQQAPQTTNMVSLDDFNTIEFLTIDDARNLYGFLTQRIVENGKASVAYMFQKCGLSTLDRTLDTWGWYDLNGFNVTPLANGRYHLVLPDPVCFNVIK